MNELDADVESFEQYYQQNRETMGALSIEASWLALKGACTVQKVRDGVRIDGITGTYPRYRSALLKHNVTHKLSPDERRERLTKLRKYASMKLSS